MLNASLGYKKSAVETLPREDLLVKLMESGILYLKEAQKKYKENEITRARELRLKAAEILMELDSTLDRDNKDKQVREIVEQLDALYGFMLKEMNESVISDDFDRLKNIEEVWEKIYEGFKEAAKIYKQMQGKSL